MRTKQERGTRKSDRKLGKRKDFYERWGMSVSEEERGRQMEDKVEEAMKSRLIVQKYFTVQT